MVRKKYRNRYEIELQMLKALADTGKPRTKTWLFQEAHTDTRTGTSIFYELKRQGLIERRGEGSYSISGEGLEFLSLMKKVIKEEEEEK